MASGKTRRIEALPVAYADEDAFDGRRYYDVTFAPILLEDRPEGVLTHYVEVTAQVRERTELRRALASEHAAASGLAHSLLPHRLPDLPGLEIAARHQPAAVEYVVGGDLYDAMAWHDGAALLVLLGAMAEPRFAEVDLALTAGDILVLYTPDGLSDAHARCASTARRASRGSWWPVAALPLAGARLPVQRARGARKAARLALLAARVTR